MSDSLTGRIERWTQAETHGDDAEHSGQALRPLTFDEYPGQDRVKANLRVFVQAAKARAQPLDHTLLHGPPGLGKTTLARIIANELAVPFYHTSGPAIDRPGDLAGILAGMQPGALLFLDEIHRLPITVEELLYTAMEDFSIDIVVGQGPAARTVCVPLSPFTLVGATTRVASLSSPLLSRFGIQERLEYYDESALCEILMRSARVTGIAIASDAALELAKRSRGTPRIANRLLRRVRDFADFAGESMVSRATVEKALTCLDIDARGLDRMDRLILRTVHERYAGGPVGIETLAATIGEEKSTLEEVYEPYLVHHGFLSRSPRGRLLTDAGAAHLRSGIRDLDSM